MFCLNNTSILKIAKNENWPENGSIHNMMSPLRTLSGLVMKFWIFQIFRFLFTLGDNLILSRKTKHHFNQNIAEWGLMSHPS